MNGFEWRYVAAGLGWGVAVGIGTGILLAWTVLISTADADVITEPSRDSVGFLIGLLIVAFYGAVMGVIPGAAAGVLIGGVLSVLVGRQPVARRSRQLTAIATLILVPSLAAAALHLLGWYHDDFRDPWFWLTLGYPTLLGVPAMRWSAGKIAQLNASRADEALEAPPLEPSARG